MSHLNSLIAACAKSRDETKARAALQKMRSHGLKPNIIAYTALLGSLEGNILQKADRIAEEVQAEGLVPDSFFYNGLLRAATDAEAPARFETILADMEARGLKRTR